MKRFLAALLAAALLLSLAACTGTPAATQSSSPSAAGQTGDQAEGGEPTTLTIPMSSCVTTLNRQFEIMKEGWVMMGPIYDELYIKDVNETRYYLAESYSVSDDGLQVTVKLKDGPTWHDGEPITADDLVFTLECNLNTSNGAGYSNVVFVNDQPITYEKVDEFTVTITLPAVSASYVELLGHLTLIPEHVFGGDTNIADAEENMLGIGSGPYKVVEFKHNEYLELEKYSDYYGGEPDIDRIVFRIIPDVNAQEVALMNGEVDLMEISSAEAVARYADDPNFTVVTYPEGRVNNLAINKYSPKFEDRRLVEAIFAALDQQAILDGAYGEGIAEPGNSVLSNKNLFYNSENPYYQQDLDKAKSLIAELGAEGTTLSLLYKNGIFMKETAQIIQQQLKEIGLTVEVTPLESAGYSEKIFSSDGDYDLYLMGYAAEGDPDNVVAGMFDGTWTQNLYLSEEAAQLWKDGRAATDDATRTQIYHQLQQQAYEDMPIYPIAFPNYVFVIRSNIKGADAIKSAPIFEDFSLLTME